MPTKIGEADTEVTSDKRKSIVGRFHLFAFVVLLAITGIASIKVKAAVGLPVHWGYNGKPDEVWARDPTLAIYPAIGLVLLALFWLIGRLVRTENIEPNRRIGEAIPTIYLGVLCALQFAFVLIGISSEIDLIRIVAFIVAAVLIMLGAVIVRAPYNVYHGLHLPWTIASRGKWLAAHRFDGGVMILGGLALAAVAVALPDPVDMLTAIALALVVPPVLAALFGTILALRR